MGSSKASSQTESNSLLRLKDLEGKPGITMAHFANSRIEMMRIVAAGKTGTAAGSLGAMNVWRDKSTVLHAAFYRNLVTESHVKNLTLGDLAIWLKKWWPELTGRHRKTSKKAVKRG